MRAKVSLIVAIMSIAIVLPAPGAAALPLAAAAPDGPHHPLDPLTSDELSLTVTLLHQARRTDATSTYYSIIVHEPPKAAVWAWQPGRPLPERQAEVVAVQRGVVYKGLVNLTDRTVQSWQPVPGVTPNVSDADYVLGVQLVHADPRWQQAVARRGVTDLSKVECLNFSYPGGYFGAPAHADHRLLRMPCGVDTGDGNFWAHPISGVETTVDLTTQTVYVNDRQLEPVPQGPNGLGASSVAQQVNDLKEAPALAAPKPLLISQPNGPTFQLDGHVVAWQNWQFHVRIDQRVGPVISTVTYNDHGRARPVMFEGSLSEVFVPYGDPNPETADRAFFDLGEYFMAEFMDQLVPGSDCPTNAVYLSAVFPDQTGQPYTKDHIACLFEQAGEGGIEWRHQEAANEVNLGFTESRPSRQLVLRAIMTNGNYDYIFDWTFQQNGAIKVAAGLTGIEEARAVFTRNALNPSNGQDLEAGTLVAPQTVASWHQHFFNYRLDLDVDGPTNRFVEAKPVVVSANTPVPEGGVRTSAMDLAIQEFHNAAEGRRPYGSNAERLVINPNVRDARGYPVGFALTGGTDTPPLLGQADWPLTRAGFLTNAMWVTPYNANQRYAAGDFVTQSRGTDGLPSWATADRNIYDTDVVVWYTLGMTHIVRPEDWPVLATEWLSFQLEPVGFFSRDPALGLPATP